MIFVCCRQQALDFARELENLIKPRGIRVTRKKSTDTRKRRWKVDH